MQTEGDNTVLVSADGSTHSHSSRTQTLSCSWEGKSQTNVAGMKDPSDTRSVQARDARSGTGAHAHHQQQRSVTKWLTIRISAVVIMREIVELRLFSRRKWL